MSDFVAVTWNVLYSVQAQRMVPTLNELLDRNVSLFLMQEAGGKDITRVLQREGLHTYVYDQYRVAWDPEVWDSEKTRHFRMANDPHYSQLWKKNVYTQAVEVELEHEETGIDLAVCSYHTPAHVQKPDRVGAQRRRIMKECFGTLRNHAKQHQRYLAGGDDNVDEYHGFGAGGKMWAFAKDRAMGLHLIQAPKPTAGRRRIDDFRTKGLTTGTGWVVGNPSDHHAHVRHFSF